MNLIQQIVLSYDHILDRQFSLTARAFFYLSFLYLAGPAKVILFWRVTTDAKYCLQGIMRKNLTAYAVVCLLISYTAGM